MGRFKHIIKKVGMSFGANILSIFVSSLLTFVIPRYFGVSHYGYWQLYLLYVSYAGIFHLGIQDGVFLRYGGQQYENLNKDRLHSQFVLFMILEIFFSVLVFFVAKIEIQDSLELFVWGGFALCLIIYLPNTFMQYLMQSVGKVKEYAVALMIEKLVLFILAVAIITAGLEKFHYLIVADLIAKLGALIYMLWQNRCIVFGNWLGITLALQETKENFSAGIFLLIANLADSLILGFTRFAVKASWDIQIFAHISLILSLCSFVLIFITATAQIIYPELKRAAPERLAFLYQFFDKIALLVLFFIPLLYTPTKVILSAWLPEYADSFRYMVFTIPMCIFQSKSILLLSSFYKVMRREKRLLVVNLCSVVIAVTMTILSVNVFHSIELTMAVATIAVAFRCFIQELYLKKLLNIRIGISVLSEIVLGFGFMLLHLLVEHIAFYVYLILYMMTATYLLKKIKRMEKYR